MKKKYIAPTVEITLVAPDTMIMAISNVDGAEGLGVGGTTEEKGIFSGNVKDDRGGFFDDEW